MITIVKGNDKIVCSYGTYEDQYKKLGYLPASCKEKEATKKVASSFEKDDKKEEEIAIKYGTKKKTTTKKGEK